MLAEARNVTVFTGAGISTESGVPDFRSPGGVWSRMKPIYFQDFVASEERREEAWTRVSKCFVSNLLRVLVLMQFWIENARSH